jgi:hypothetical protein
MPVALQCVTLVRQHFPDANAAKYSNIGRAECDAVYNATGLIYDPTMQTCLFDDSWRASTHGRRRLDASGVPGECEANISISLDKLKAAQAEELDKLRSQMAQLDRQQGQTNEELTVVKALLGEILKNQRLTTEP